jgi:hypothetical protein
MRSAVPPTFSEKTRVMHLYLLTHIQLSKKAAVAKTNAELDRYRIMPTARIRGCCFRRCGN